MNKQDIFDETYGGVRQLVERLLGPDGCPWDKEQTPETLKHLFLEECRYLIRTNFYCIKRHYFLHPFRDRSK